MLNPPHRRKDVSGDYAGHGRAPAVFLRNGNWIDAPWPRVLDAHARGTNRFDILRGSQSGRAMPATTRGQGPA
jgi:hypothetical protein